VTVERDYYQCGAWVFSLDSVGKIEVN
jgi:hypothetical protein